MINFRFHLISLIAVFLALAVGVVMGYGVLGQPTVDTLQGRINAVEARADAVREENARLRREQSRLEDVFREVGAFAATGRLAGESILPVAVRGVDAEKVRETVRLARQAQATAPAILWLEDKWELTSDDDADELAEIIGTTSTSRGGIREAAARALANRIIVGPLPGRADLLTALDDAGFIAFEEVDEVAFEPARYEGRPSRILLVSGNAADVRFDRGVLPIAAALAASGRLVEVADEWRDVSQGPGRGQELSAVRDGELAEFVATLDSFDTVDGPLLAVLVLADLGRGTVGHYGFGAGADRAAPEWWAE